MTTSNLAVIKHTSHAVFLDSKDKAGGYSSNRLRAGSICMIISENSSQEYDKIFEFQKEYKNDEKAKDFFSKLSKPLLKVLVIQDVGETKSFSFKDKFVFIHPLSVLEITEKAKEYCSGKRFLIGSTVCDFSVFLNIIEASGGKRIKTVVYGSKFPSVLVYSAAKMSEIKLNEIKRKSKNVTFLEENEFFKIIK